MRRISRSGTVVLVAALLLASCGGEAGSRDTDTSAATPSTAAPSEGSDEGLRLLVLSDSSAWGVADPWARKIEAELGVPVDATDLAVGMYYGERMLADLRTEGSEEREAAREADIIMVWVSPGGLDLIDSSCDVDSSGGTPPEPTTRADFAPYAQLWDDVLDEILALRDGQPTALRVRDLYNPAIAEHAKAGRAEECTAALMMISATARRAAHEAGATFVPVYSAFNGPQGLRDPVASGLISPDGTHLSRKGVRLQVALLHRAGYAEL